MEKQEENKQKEDNKGKENETKGPE